MGDVIKRLEIRSYEGEKEKRKRLYFDSGSSYTFAKKTVGQKFKEILKLEVPKKFSGLGNGSFEADSIMHLEVRLLGFWCSHYAYVVEDEILEEDEDLLVGHDFMQKFDVKLDLKNKSLILNRASLKRAQKVRKIWFNIHFLGK